MAYSDIYAAATDAAGSLRKQIAVAAFKAAVDVSNEAGSGHEYETRKTWARKVLLSPTGPTEMAALMAWKVLETATIQANPAAASDGDVQFVVSSLVDIFAGN